MNVAITVWEHRISPVFDSARTLLIAEIKDNALVSTSYLTFDFDRPLELLRMLRAEKVSNHYLRCDFRGTGQHASGCRF